MVASVALGFAVLGYGRASASANLSVTVVPPASVPAGMDAPLTVRAEGERAEGARLEYSVSGGSIAGVISLNAAGDGVAEATVYVHRDAPGEATLSVARDGVVVATGVARFAPYGQIVVSATLPAEAHASARTWRFEVVSDGGQVMETLSLGTSGAAPTGSATSSWLPYGQYTVRQIFGNDTRTSCAPGIFYAATSPAGAATGVGLRGLQSGVAFTLRACEDAPTSLGASIPIDVIDGVSPIDEVRGIRWPGPGAPLPPAAGTGTVDAAPGRTSDAAVLAGLALLLSAPALLATRRVMARIRD